MLVAVGLTLISASMTVVGYTSLYAEKTLIISALFITLEITKATIFGVVFVIGEAKHKIPLIALAICLILLSFVGHLSYLSKAYNTNKVSVQVSKDYVEQTKLAYSTQLQDIETQIAMLQERVKAQDSEIQTLTKASGELETANSRHWSLSTNKRRIKELQDSNIKLLAEIKDLTAQRASLVKDSLASSKEQGVQIAETANRSVFQYTADLFGISQDKLANSINVALALVIDTLALMMIWVAGSLWQQRKREQFWDESPLSALKRDPIEMDGLKPARTKVSKDNANNYLFEGNTVQDVVKMSDDEIEALKSKVKTQDQLDWLNFCLTLREQESELKYEELK